MTSLIGAFVRPSLCSYICLSVLEMVHLSSCLHVNPSVCILIRPFVLSSDHYVPMFVCLFCSSAWLQYLSTYPFVMYLLICPSIYLYVYISNHLHACFIIFRYQYMCDSVCLSIWTYNNLFVCLSVLKDFYRERLIAINWKLNKQF